MIFNYAINMIASRDVCKFCNDDDNDNNNNNMYKLDG